MDWVKVRAGHKVGHMSKGKERAKVTVTATVTEKEMGMEKETALEEPR